MCVAPFDVVYCDCEHLTKCCNGHCALVLVYEVGSSLTSLCVNQLVLGKLDYVVRPNVTVTVIKVLTVIALIALLTLYLEAAVNILASCIIIVPKSTIVANVGALAVCTCRTLRTFSTSFTLDTLDTLFTLWTYFTLRTYFTLWTSFTRFTFFTLWTLFTLDTLNTLWTSSTRFTFYNSNTS